MTEETTRPRVDIAVVVPAYNEAESLPELVDRIEKAIDGMGRTWEAWIVDDGSTDDTFAVTEKLAAARPQVHGLSFGRNFGKAAAISAGVDHSRGEIVVTLDGDLQDVPEEIPRFLEKLESEGLDLVSGWKQRRKDSLVKNWSSRLFNRVTGCMCGLRLHDFNCGFKAYRAPVVHALDLYGEMHRFVPIYASWRGARVSEMPVTHHPRSRGRTKYGLERVVKVLLEQGLLPRVISARALARSA